MQKENTLIRRIFEKVLIACKPAGWRQQKLTYCYSQSLVVCAFFVFTQQTWSVTSGHIVLPKNKTWSHGSSNLKNRLIICFGHGERTLVSGYLQLSVFISQLVTYLQLALERGGSVIVACVFV